MSIANGSRSRFALYLDLIRWDRPAGTYLLLWPTLSALWIAAGGFPGWRLLVVFVLDHPVLRKLALCSMVFSAVQVCLTSYVVSFLSSDLAWGLVAAGFGSAVAQIAGIVGRVLWGVAADRLRNARRVLVGLAWTMALCGVVLGLLGPGTGHGWVLALLVGYGATAIGWNGVFLATAAGQVPLQQAATATSGCLFFTYFGVVIGPPLFGVAAAAFGRLGTGFALLALPLAWTLWSLQRADWRSHA